MLNTSVLSRGRVPRWFVGRGLGIVPRGGVLVRATPRLMLENSLIRFTVALAPFPAAALAFPDWALTISQLPLVMFLLVLFLDQSIFSIASPEKRRALIDPAEAERGLDLLTQRARAILTRIAAGRDLREGELMLAVEQSPMARVPPLTLLSVQVPGDPGTVLELDAQEAAALEGLFDADLTERKLQTINLSLNEFRREFLLEARSVSAHARMAALAARQGAA